jgi:hypothetical protein
MRGREQMFVLVAVVSMLVASALLAAVRLVPLFEHVRGMFG